MVTCVSAVTQRQADEWENFTVEKREGFMYTLLKGCWLSEAVGELTVSKASYVIG